MTGDDGGDDDDDGDFRLISLFRDYVNSWYKGISRNPAFPDEVSRPNGLIAIPNYLL